MTRLRIAKSCMDTSVPSWRLGHGGPLQRIGTLGGLAPLDGAPDLLAQLTDAHQAACATMASELLQRTAA